MVIGSCKPESVRQQRQFNITISQILSSIPRFDVVRGLIYISYLFWLDSNLAPYLLINGSDVAAVTFCNSLLYSYGSACGFTQGQSEHTTYRTSYAISYF